MAVQIAKPNDMMMRDPLKGPMYRPNPTQQQKQDPSAAAQFGQMAQNRAMEKGLQAGEEKIMEGASSFMTPSVAAPSAAQMTGASQMAGSGLSPGAAQAVFGSGSSAAPLAAQAAGQTAGQLAATTGSQLATGAATNAAAAGAGTGAMATMGAAVPYVGAALLADEVLGLGLRESVLGFDKGGQVGPLYAASGASTDYNYIKSRIDKLQSDRETLDLNDADDESIAIEINKLMDELYKSDGGQVKPTYAAMGLGPLAMKKIKEEGMKGGGMMGLASMLSEGGTAGPLYAADGDQVEYINKRIDRLYYEMDLPGVSESDEDSMMKEIKTLQNEYDKLSGYKYGGGMAGPLSKVEYKSAGGETYKLSYGGPISKGA